MKLRPTDAPDDEANFGTRWRVMLPVAAIAVAAAGGIAATMVTGVLAVGFTSEQGTMTLTTKGLRASQFRIITANVDVRGSDGSTAARPQVRIDLGASDIDGLCATQQFSVLGATRTLVVEAGDNIAGNFDVHADALVIDASGAKGHIATQGTLHVNENAASVAPQSGGQPDQFGLQASKGSLTNVTAIVRSIDVPQLLSTSNFHISIKSGSYACPDPGGN